ncbi:hypothetical protein FH972_003397 [Carpinus fangiana]|uniref:Phytocyanin domain-containing protein n=1 Tax=Carpinus fangiana TaxID=176857 RepID=A0A5N6QK86_9ROSI|nr:hypothetical protein FH972_003397 [Carpinus fangiana]
MREHRQMATTMNVRLLLVVLLIAAAATVLPRTEAAEHTVGGSNGWSVFNGAADFYTSWAANNSFAVGDVLVFNFNTGAHDVATVTKDAFDACNKTSANNVTTTGPANITLTTAGDHYFICTIDMHCTGGQKLAINVGTTPPTPPGVTPPPPPSSGTTPPPPPSSGTSASSLAATFSLILVTIASTIFYLF